MKRKIPQKYEALHGLKAVVSREILRSQPMLRLSGPSGSANFAGFYSPFIPSFKKHGVFWRSRIKCISLTNYFDQRKTQLGTVIFTLICTKSLYENYFQHPYSIFFLSFRIRAFLQIIFLLVYLLIFNIFFDALPGRR